MLCSPCVCALVCVCVFECLKRMVQSRICDLWLNHFFCTSHLFLYTWHLMFLSISAMKSVYFLLF